MAADEASAQAAGTRARYAIISAPVDGILIGRNVEVGDMVQPGKELMTLSPQGRTQVVVEIDDRNLRLLALGQRALVSADAHPLQRFPAALVYIKPGVNLQTGAVAVKLDVPSPPAMPRQDMTVSVDIAVARRPAALLVAADALHDPEGAAPWVLRIENGRAIRRPVEIGLRSGGLAEVLAGLRVGDAVIPTSVTAIEAGARVRPAPALR